MDLAKALMWYKKAAEQGHILAETNYLYIKQNQ